MKSLDRVRNYVGGHVSKRARTTAAMAVVAIAAFVLGGLLLGNGGPPGAEHAGSATEAPSSGPEVWTCSMHPQIRLPKPGKCPICFMDLIPLESGGDDDLGPRQLRLSETAKQLAKIQTTPAVRALAESEIRMVGNLTYDESKVAYITAWVPGRLDRLYADYTGMQVNKGDHLVYIYSPELLAAQEELIQAKEAVFALSATSSDVLLSTARATLEAARDKLRLFGLTAAQIEQIENTKKATDHLTIYAPIGGVVVHKNALEGMYVETGSRIYTIANLSRLWLMLEAYESDLPWLRYGQRVEFTSQSFPGERFEATISFIDPLVDPKTRTVRVRAVVDNSDRRLKPDMFVRGVVKSRINRDGMIVDERLAGKWIAPMHPEIVKDWPGKCDICGMDLVPASSLGYAAEDPSESEKPLLIPASAPLITGKRAVVYVEIPDPEGPLFEGREVELGPRAGNFYVVKSGINEGELVVTNGAFKIDSELELQAKPSMMSPQGGGSTPDHHHAHPESGAPNPQTGTAAQSRDRSVKIGVEARRSLSPVYAAYFEVWEALADDDHKAAGKAGGALAAAVKKVDTSVFTGVSRERWTVLSGSLSQPAEKISEADDIKASRDAFYNLSLAVIDLQKSFGHAADASYRLSYCPMARDGAGAYWLQQEDELLNPYFGASMLYCGSVKETYLPYTANER